MDPRAGKGDRGAGDPVREFLRARGCPDHVVRGGLEGLVADWERVAQAVEQGYPLDTLDDYLNDMDVRELIAEAMVAVPKSLVDARAARLGAADARIRAALIPSGRCLWGEAIATSRGWKPAREWWYFMRPARPGPGLRADLGLDGEES